MEENINKMKKVFRKFFEEQINENAVLSENENIRKDDFQNTWKGDGHKAGQIILNFILQEGNTIEESFDESKIHTMNMDYPREFDDFVNAMRFIGYNFEGPPFFHFHQSLRWNRTIEIPFVDFLCLNVLINNSE